MANRGYDTVVDVDDEGELGHTDLQEDLEFHPSNFGNDNNTQKPLPFHNATANGSKADLKSHLFSTAFYAQYFDVDTSEVLSRCWAALYPRANFLDVLDGKPDLYGPFWIAATVVGILFLASTISEYISRNSGDAAGKYAGYDFTLLSAATGMIYGYTFIIPTALWAILRWFGSQGANVLECVCLYGYANLIWLPVALISWSPIDPLNWIFVGVGAVMSGMFLVRNLWPVVSATDARISRIVLIMVIVLHAGLSLAIKFIFFAHKSPITSSPVSATPETEIDDGTEVLRRMLLG